MQRRDFVKAAGLMLAPCFSAGNAPAFAQEPITTAVLFAAAIKGIVSAAAGQGFLSIIGADSLTQTSQRVAEIVAAAVKEIENYISATITQNDIQTVTGQLNGTMALLNEYNATKDESTLARANQDATYAITAFESIGPVTAGIYPVATTVKLAAVVAEYKRTTKPEFYNVYLLNAITGELTYDNWIGVIIDKLRKAQNDSVTELSIRYWRDPTSCGVDFSALGKAHYSPPGSYRGPYHNAPIEIRRRYGGYKTGCMEFQQAVAERDAILASILRSTSELNVKYLGYMTSLAQSWRDVGMATFSKTRAQFEKDLWALAPHVNIHL